MQSPRPLPVPDHLLNLDLWSVAALPQASDQEGWAHAHCLIAVDCGSRLFLGTHPTRFFATRCAHLQMGSVRCDSAQSGLMTRAVKKNIHHNH